MNRRLSNSTDEAQLKGEKIFFKVQDAEEKKSYLQGSPKGTMISRDPQVVTEDICEELFWVTILGSTSSLIGS